MYEDDLDFIKRLTANDNYMTTSTDTVGQWSTFMDYAISKTDTIDPKQIAKDTANKVLEKIWEFATKDSQMVTFEDGVEGLAVNYSRLEGALNTIKDIINKEG